MNALVTGGAGSGKSAFAEQLAAHLACDDAQVQAHAGTSGGRRSLQDNPQAGFLCATGMPRGRLVYLATMRNDGPEARRRIERHRKQRAHRGFFTIECPDALPSALCLGAARQQVILLDDLGNLVANALFAADGSMRDPDLVLDELVRQVTALFEHGAHVVVVGNEVGCEGRPPFAGTRTWVRLMGSLCCRIAAQADVVAEVVAGIPLVVKGELA